MSDAARSVAVGAVTAVAVAAWVAAGCARLAWADPTVGDRDDFESAHAWTGHSEEICFDVCTIVCIPFCSTEQGAQTQLGGPGGAGDTFLRLQDLPSHGVEAWNRSAERTGSYVAAGVGRLEMDLANLGETETLVVRVGLEGAGTRFVTSDAAAVAVLPQTGWQPAVFELRPWAMTRVSGSASLAAVLAAVQEVRILHAQSAAWDGEPGPDLGVDDLEWRAPAPHAVPVPGWTHGALAVLLWLAARAGRGRARPHADRGARPQPREVSA